MANEMTEAQAVNLVRNALLIAGHEMGKQGDHWPVIKSTVHSIVEDWEQLQIERNVDAEMKVHLYEQLEIMERGLPLCSAENKDKVASILKELRDVYDAYFTSVDRKSFDFKNAEMPMHIVRAKNIIDTLEADNDE